MQYMPMFILKAPTKNDQCRYIPPLYQKRLPTPRNLIHPCPTLRARSCVHKKYTIITIKKCSNI